MNRNKENTNTVGLAAYANKSDISNARPPSRIGQKGPTRINLLRRRNATHIHDKTMSAQETIFGFDAPET